MKKQVIPIVYCINNKYAIPAATCSVSILENASKDYFYKIYIIQTDITDTNKRRIIKSVEKFKEISEVVFITGNYDFNKIWSKIKITSHFSKEMLYKLTIDSIFTQYDKIILTDVDVIFKGDISKAYFELNVEENFYLAGIRQVVSKKDKHKGYGGYLDRFTKEEVEKLGDSCGAGFLVYNLKKIRDNNMQKVLLDYLVENINRLYLIEQDVIGLCFNKKIKFLPLEYMLCTQVYDELEKNSAYTEDIWFYSKNDVIYAIENTIQLHYACAKKPWKHPNMTKANEWYNYFHKTDYKQIELIKYKVPNIKAAILNAIKRLKN